MIRIEVQVRRKAYAQADVLENIDFDIRAGEFTCLLAPSGAGKTTLLNIIAGLDREFEGAATVICDKRRFGMVFQEPRLMPWLTLRDNILLVCAEADMRAHVDHWLQLTDLPQAADRFPQQLSLGMQRRAALARAMVVQPQVLLLDEPFTSLDKPMADALRSAVLDQAKASGAAVIMTTHDLREAIASADRVLFLSESPAGVMLDLRISVAARGDVDHHEVREFCNELNQRHPRLLEGVIHNEQHVDLRS